jgi:cytochrome c-type biogenesis protein CcmE
MKTRHKRLILIVVGVLGLTVGGLFVLNAFRSNLVYFYSPTEVLEGKAPRDQTIRIGGMVEKGSVKRAGDSLLVQFVVTDMNKTIPVRYEGILPDLFRDGQGVVTLGRLGADGTFMAREVLAKHDENYMPPEAAAAMKGGSFQSGK